jgi:hypothetical protein
MFPSTSKTYCHRRRLRTIGQGRRGLAVHVLPIDSPGAIDHAIIRKLPTVNAFVPIGQTTP